MNERKGVIPFDSTEMTLTAGGGVGVGACSVGLQAANATQAAIAAKLRSERVITPAPPGRQNLVIPSIAPRPEREGGGYHKHVIGLPAGRLESAIMTLVGTPKTATIS
jgi:hypothetical protein